MITFNFNNFISYLMWDNNTSEIIAVIAHPNPAANSGKLDRTFQVEKAIREHFDCEKVTLPKDNIDVVGENEFTDFSVDTVENGEDSVRDIRMTPITTY